MKIFVAGASGAIGARLIPMLVKAGHDVTGMTRTAAKAPLIRAAGAVPVIADALDQNAVTEAVCRASPDVIVHELTSIPANIDIRHFDRDFAKTNALRTQGLDHLLAAASAAGCRRVVAQSFAGWPYARTGSFVKTEEDPLDSSPPPALRVSLDAIRYLETTVTNTQGIEGIVLRYGYFYGPGNTIGEGGSFLKEVRKRRIPIVGNGAGVWSFVHIDDAACATVLAIERGRPGIYNIVDDDPAPVSEWLPALAEAAGGKPPFRIPAWLGRIAVGSHGVVMMTEIRGASNEKAKRDLGWKPMWASWRDGFRRALN
jgi:nucleoside-diphosphate-sugar epimerase